MADALQKVRTGDPFQIPAGAYNKFIDAARANEDSKQTFGRAARGEVPTTTVFPVRNITGSSVNRFEILGIDDPVIGPTDDLDEFNNNIAFDGSLPADKHKGKFCVLLEPLNDQELGNACYAGACITKVEIFEDGFRSPFADIKDGTKSELIQDRDGSAQILFHEPGTGIKTAIVRLGNHVVEFWAEITSITPIGTDTNRWTYGFKEMSLQIASDLWGDHPQQRTGTAKNTIEIPNDGGGFEGNGVDLDTLTSPTLWPAGLGAIVRIHEWFKDTSTKEYWFTWQNIVSSEDPSF